ncbi:MAG: 6-bladed beta-propeller [Lachnoclostridium sp.]|nr:6-bladed beta-propeller [Lachnoclostridium sp.]
MIILVTGVYSCVSHGDEGESFVYNINLDDAQSLDRLNISEFCSDVTTVILETSNNTMLSNIDKIIRVNDRLYVFDRSLRNTTFCSVTEFDMDGKVIRRFGNIGRGPREYMGISDYSIDEQSRLMYLLDHQTGRLISYSIDNGEYIESMNVRKKGMHSNIIACVGNLLYADLLYYAFEKSNYMLKSWNMADPVIENHYLPIGEHCKGWTNTTLSNNNNFIYNDGNQYALFSNKFSPEIFKLSEDGIGNYIYIDSDYFIDEKGRQIVSEAWDSYTFPHALPKSPSEILWDLDCFNGLCQYFETKRHIGFSIARDNRLPMYVYDKNNEVVQKTGSLIIDSIVKSEHREANGLFTFLSANNDGIFYSVDAENIGQLRMAAREGMLVDGLDRLEELKNLSEDSNPVIFYMKFKDPLR